MPGVIARDPGVDVVVLGAARRRGAGALAAGAAAVFGSGIIGKDAFGVADRLADRLVGEIALGPDSADQALRKLAAVDREVVHQLRFLAELLHDLRAFGADGVDREAEREPDRVVGDRFHQGDNLAGIDEAERAGEQVDAAAPGLGRGQLEVGDGGGLLGKAGPDVAEAVVTRRLTFKCGGAVDVGGNPHVVEEPVHRAADVGAGDCRDERRERQARCGQLSDDLRESNSHGRAPWW